MKSPAAWRSIKLSGILLKESRKSTERKRYDRDHFIADGYPAFHPLGKTQILPQDNLIVYGRLSALEELDQRQRNWRGDHEHRKAIAKQEQVIAEEEQRDLTRVPQEETL